MNPTWPNRPVEGSSSSSQQSETLCEGFQHRSSSSATANTRRLCGRRRWHPTSLLPARLPLRSPATVRSQTKFFFSWSLQLLCNSTADPTTAVLPHPFFFSTGNQHRWIPTMQSIPANQEPNKQIVLSIFWVFGDLQQTRDPDPWIFNLCPTANRTRVKFPPRAMLLSSHVCNTRVKTNKILAPLSQAECCDGQTNTQRRKFKQSAQDKFYVVWRKSMSMINPIKFEKIKITTLSIFSLIYI